MLTILSGYTGAFEGDKEVDAIFSNCYSYCSIDVYKIFNFTTSEPSPPVKDIIFRIWA